MCPDMVAVRPMVADDAPAFARCMQRVYGNTYKPFVYEPEEVRKLLAGGRLRSVVAVAPDGEIVAHQGVMREHPGSRIAEVPCRCPPEGPARFRRGDDPRGVERAGSGRGGADGRCRDLARAGGDVGIGGTCRLGLDSSQVPAGAPE